MGFIAPRPFGVGDLGWIENQVRVALGGDPEGVKNAPVPLVSGWMNERFVEVVVGLPGDIGVGVAAQFEQVVQARDLHGSPSTGGRAGQRQFDDVAESVN